MNLSILQDSVKTMSSREMASLCQKPHDNVLKLIRNLIAGGVVNNTVPHNYVHEQNNQVYTEYLSNKRDSLVIVARLSPEFTAAVIDRWQALEAQVSAPAIPQSLSEALRLAADQAERIEQQQAQIAAIAPKAAALDVIDASIGSIGVRETTKTLGVQQNKFVAWCINHNWMYRDSRQKLTPFSHRIQQGFMEQRPVTYRDKQNMAQAAIQSMFTPRGLTHLAKIFSIVKEVA